VPVAEITYIPIGRGLLCLVATMKGESGDAGMVLSSSLDVSFA